MRSEQLAVSNLAKTFRLLPDNIVLISDRGTVAIPEDGTFNDVDSFDSWTVEGDKATGPRITGSGSGSTAKWKPQSYPPPIRASASASGSSTRQVSITKFLLDLPTLSMKLKRILLVLLLFNRLHMVGISRLKFVLWED